MNMKKWYKRIISKFGISLFIQRKELAIRLYEQKSADNNTKKLVFHIPDKSGKDCVIQLIICE